MFGIIKNKKKINLIIKKINEFIEISNIKLKELEEEEKRVSLSTPFVKRKIIFLKGKISSYKEILEILKK